jgi:elongator complex protein 2
VKIWIPAADHTQWTARATTKCTEGVNSVDMIEERDDSGQLLLALGTETGAIAIYRITTGESVETEILLKVDTRCVLSTYSLMHRTDVSCNNSISHVGAVNRLAWRRTKKGELQLASCSEDRSVRVFDISM